MKVYVFLDVDTGKAEQVARTLRTHACVTTVDVLEGPPDILMTLEAGERKELARVTVIALASVENMTLGSHLMPVK